MHSTIVEKNQLRLGLYVATSFLFFGLLFFQEFIFSKNSTALLFLASFFAILAWLVVVKFFSKTQKKHLQQYAALAIFLWLGIVTVHFILNIINLYQLGTLPNWFYSLKLYRFVSLTGLFLVQVTIFFCGCYLVSKIKKITNPFKNTLLGLVGLFVAVTALSQFHQAAAILYDQSIQMSINAHISFEDRFTYKQGGSAYYGWIWPYSQFIVRHTPSDAVLLIPPQNNIWKMEGNADYFRWFMYPRKLTHMTNSNIPAGVTHVLIALGECSEGACGWPKIAIKAEHIKKIILIDRQTHSEATLTETDYYLDTDHFQWGIIELQPL